MSRPPNRHDSCNGVDPSAARASISAPRLRSLLIIWRPPNRHDLCNGVDPSAARASISAPLSKSRTMSDAGPWYDVCSAVCALLSLASISTPLSRQRFTKGILPAIAAKCRDVCACRDEAKMSAPPLIKARVVER